MSRKKNGLTDFTPLKERVNVTLHKSNLKGTDDSPVYYGKIRKKKLNIITILNEMQENNQSLISKETMFYIASELSSRMMKKLSEGYALEMLDFGTLFITMKGQIEKDARPKEIAKHFGIGFTPSKEAVEAVQNFEVSAVFDVGAQHCIRKVCVACMEETENGVILAGCVARIFGKAIKLGGADSGLYLAPVNKNGNAADRTSWIKIEGIYSNVPSRIDFMVPPEIDTSRQYKVIVRTSLAAGGKPMKTAVECESGAVQVLTKTAGVR